VSPAVAGAIRVQVAPALPVFETWTYSAPAALELRLGHAVMVPFGPRQVAGYIIGPGDPAVPEARLRPVSRLLDAEPAFDEGQLAFMRWIAAYYLSPLGEVIATAMPAGLKRHGRRVILPSDEAVRELARPRIVEDERVQVLREVVARPGLTAGSLKRRLHGEVEEPAVVRALAALMKEGLLREEEQQEGNAGRIQTVGLARPDAAEAPVRGARMSSVLRTLAAAGGELDLAVLVGREGGGARDAVHRLVEAGLLVRGEREDRGRAGESLPPPSPPPPLHGAQLQAVQAILAAVGHKPFLLHGVTGSGKTEVYLHAASEILQRGRQVLVLVPEISLTPQLTQRFQARFGEGVAVLHSGLSPAERHRQWRRIRAGEATVTVGARSGLFAPFSRLGLIVVDEEHDDSYKQDDGVRYHARDLAVVRARMADCPVVLGTATPSGESWQNAAEGRYALLRLRDRATPRPVPEIELVDLRGRPPTSPLSEELIAALESTLRAGGKAIVLYNRRGYAPVVECPGCGHSFLCPSCGVGLVLHRQQGGRLQCHHCGYHQPHEPACLQCGTDLEVLGHGTARVEESLHEAFPEARILRMDADTTQARGSHARILDQFRDGDAQILVGTQMVAKGHDFPDVQLSAVVGVDHLLTMPDFRNAERVHALVTQLAGRAGRGSTAGRVLVQTLQPDHHVFQQLVQPTLPPPQPDDPGCAFPLDPILDGFLASEMRQRRLLGHPPYAALVLLRVEGADAPTALGATRELALALRGEAPRGPVRVQGPVSAPMARLMGRWRFQLVVRAADRALLRRWLTAREALLRRPPGKGLRLTVDVDPRNLM
jgi:primosomal protein N' (replication factor Y) (superfamily II helicase)